ncbi:phytoene/squalene synthase family protein [Blastomonas marina]|uniref:Phytoene synthase n=1 Tax=Blastomonas marina TaxID=1867408 RepID=A0ABQ1F3C3_9SPHN|nr:phytoene/squalene synthase family protein [Blastomonas marina]WPZ03873.1 phytoene/squalene synthase family protein [Blastomonas marina]GFZ98111.1 phytoene synthase [Blastomonas marina]
MQESYWAIREGSKSFAAASRLFGRDTRERSWLLYHWCRRCDDLADGQEFGGELSEVHDTKEAEDKVQAIRALTRRALEGQPTLDLAFDSFGMVAAEVGLTQDMADDVIAGFALDAQGWQPRTEAEMMRYCYHVAGAVGVMMARVMQAPDDAWVFDRACDLGLAFQLANIARDVVEDDAAGRCYLPQEWLAEADIKPGEHAKPHNRFKLAAVVAKLVRMMDRHADAARLGAARLGFRDRWAVLAAARIYTAIGRKVLDRGQLAWNKRVVVSGPEKLWHIIAAWWEALRNNPHEPDQMPIYSRELIRPLKGW